MDTKRLRQRVLDLAIHGKLVPQNPQDEPASEHLKRIAEEKERLVKEGKIKKSKKKDNEDIDEVPFEVPQGWVWTNVETIATKITDGTHKTPRYTNKGIKFVSAKNLYSGKLSFNECKYISLEEHLQLYKRCNPEYNDILISKSGSIGTVTLNTVKFEFSLFESLALIKYNKDYILPEALKLAVQYACTKLTNDEVKGVGVTHLPIESIKKLQIPLPPLAEQHRIVSEVEKYFSLIDILEESENNLLQSIQKAKSKILDLAIGGKLIKIEGNYKEVSLNSLAVDSADGPFGSNLKREHYTTNKEVRIIQLSNIGEDGWRDENTKYTTFEHLPNIARSEVHPGDIVIAKMMPAGRAILCPTGDSKYVLSSDAVKFVLKEGIYNKYVLYAINSSHFREQVYDNVQGVTRVRTSLKKLREYTIPIPSLSEQHKIVERIEMLNQQLDNIAEALK